MDRELVAQKYSYAWPIQIACGRRRIAIAGRRFVDEVPRLRWRGLRRDQWVAQLWKRERPREQQPPPRLLRPLRLPAVRNRQEDARSGLLSFHAGAEER